MCQKCRCFFPAQSHPTKKSEIHRPWWIVSRQALWNSNKICRAYHTYQISSTLRILTPPMETPDPPNDTPGALKQVVLTPHDIPWSLRAVNSWLWIPNHLPNFNKKWVLYVSISIVNLHQREMSHQVTINWRIFNPHKNTVGKICWIAFGSIKSVGKKQILYTWNPKQPLFFWMFGETPIVHVMIWNHPIETVLKF